MMTIIFVDKKTKEPAELNLDGVEFVLDQEGNVREYIDQSYADSCSLLYRDDIEAQMPAAEIIHVDTKPCPACKSPLVVPDQFLNAMDNLKAFIFN